MPAVDTIARKIIESYFLRRGQAIDALRQQEADVIVSAGALSWQVRPVARDGYFVKSEGYAFYQVTPTIVADPPPRPDGFALTPGGEIYHLNDARAFKAFFSWARPLLNPVELAALLSRYQATGPHQNLILRREDVVPTITDEQLDGIAGFTLPRSEKEDDLWSMEFCTFSLAPEPPDRRFRISMLLWTVRVFADNRIEWHTRRLVRGLASPIYTGPIPQEDRE